MLRQIRNQARNSFVKGNGISTFSTRFYFADKFAEGDRFHKELKGVFPAVTSSAEPGAASGTNLFRYAFNNNQLTLFKLGLERALAVYDAGEGLTEEQHKKLYEAGVPDEINYDILKYEYNSSKASLKDIYAQYERQYSAYYRLADGVAGFGTDLMIPKIMTDYFNTLQIAASGLASLPYYRNNFNVLLRPDIISGFSFKNSDYVFEDTFQDQMLTMIAKLEDQEFMSSFSQEQLREELLAKRQPKTHSQKEYFENISMGGSS